MVIDEVDTDTDGDDMAIYDDEMEVLAIVREEGASGIFIVERSDSEETIVRKLRMLREENFTTEMNFISHCIPWTERIRNEMMVTFLHYNNLGLQWNEATFYDFRDGSTSNHINRVLQSPNTIQLFRSFVLYNEDFTAMDRQVAHSVALILRHGRDVSIEQFQIGNGAMSILSEGLVTLSGSVAQAQELKFYRGVILIDDQVDDEVSSERKSAEQCLADGLLRNQSLVSFRYEHLLDNCSPSDSTAARIVRSLIGHKSLKEFRLSGFTFGEATTSAISCLLAFPNSKLSVLQLSDRSTVRARGVQFDFEDFFEELPINKSLRTLDLSGFYQNFDHDTANQLLGSLWKLPSLKCLKLAKNAIRDLVRLASNFTMTTPHHSCLRVLDLSSNDFDFGGHELNDEHPAARAILHLLDAFPELGYFGLSVAEQFPISVIERMDLNRCSGMLLRGAEIPLSVWAVVFAKVNTDPILKDTSTASRKASAIYNMLHGPVFAGRGT